ncbi:MULTISPECIES: lytic transglycosylase domain-containing protein [unclassified Janthinobacterium]|uniref:lytic transglycosylase domain-containing protein n=1 Tax=unclassified Janthinobacterium TaxID=2610881 RepID=UPI00160CC7CA|nr:MULTISPECIES: lytic transglycosylase domain-containing protein [unclassified Janthinobacterium]MBB5369348.1 soluble lytic murein transglycosylase-like protein [Janthinobacterium sp. K2C7]MBB5381116.1 soluble lytic murein transglycosylase-like protein [Janthinobacterium sp. K2Li3]MBB5387731.1 soluble lytic murein transglycosylase-like protein [Janthinobacterium sp. K2E3]
MTHRSTEASSDASTVAGQPALAQLRARAKAISARGVLATAQHTLTVFGISALALIALLMFRPDLGKQLTHSLFPLPMAEAQAVEAPHLSALMEAPASVQTAANEAPLSKEEKALLGTQRQQQWVTTWLSKRYRVANDATNMLVSTAYLTAREIKLDPLLILAVMAIESGLNPFAESPVGAQGLMQVMSKIHHEKFQDMGGVQAALNPVANIRVGSLILKDYVTRGGSVEAGLKTYVGAAGFATDSGYGSRVLAEYRRLKQVSAGQRVPTNGPVLASSTPAPVIMPAKDTGSLTIKVVPSNNIAGL